MQFDCPDTPDSDPKKPVLKLTVTCGGMPVESVYHPEPAGDFPVRPAIQGRITAVPKETLPALQIVAGCASTDTTRYILNGVLFSPDKGGILIATDGRRLAGAPARVPGREFVLPNAAVQVLGHPDFNARDAAILQPETGEGPHIQFRSGPHTLIARTIEGNYPNYRQVIPPEFLADVTIPETHRSALISWLRSLNGKSNSTSVRLTWKTPDHLTLTLRGSYDSATQRRNPPGSRHHFSGRPTARDFLQPEVSGGRPGHRLHPAPGRRHHSGRRHRSRLRQLLPDHALPLDRGGSR